MPEENKRKRKKETDHANKKLKDEQTDTKVAQIPKDEEPPLVENKKHRKRRKGLYKRLAEQLEFYFSDANLRASRRKDGFMMQLVKKDPWVPLSTFENFNKVKAMVSELKSEGSVQHHLVKALEVKKSSMFVISEDGTKIKRVTDVEEKGDIEECTIYIENLSPDTTHEMLKTRFEQFGPVDYISIPKFKISKKAKGFAFIEFASKDGVKAVLKACGVNFDEANLPDPSTLASIKTFSQEEEEGNDSSKENEDEESKPKHENEDDDFDAPKRLRIDENLKKSESQVESTPQKTETELLTLQGFRILTKTQWRRLRNQYLNQQRKNMSATKAYLKTHAGEGDSKTDPEVKTAAKHDDKSKPKSKKSKDAANGKTAAKVKTQDYTPGLIVKIGVPDGVDDAKRVKKVVKETEDVEYIDVKIGAPEFFVRCRNEEQTDRLLSKEIEKWTLVKLKGSEESDYHKKIEKDREEKRSGKVVVHKEKRKKKLMDKMEKHINSHIHFGD